MLRDWHELFGSWSKPPTETEEAKGSKAAEMIRDALRSDPTLKDKDFDVYPTGSYRNNTNVRLGSDIDIAVVLSSAFFSQFPSDGILSREALGFTSAEYGLTQFRTDIGTALSRKFGTSGVAQGDKTYNVHESRRRLDADVTAFVVHRRYTGKKNTDGSWHYYEGVETRSRREPNQRIINWHQRHYDEGVKRNEITKRRFKRVTRILKRLRQDMKRGEAPALPAL